LSKSLGGIAMHKLNLPQRRMMQVRKLVIYF
jgi:hypothetical protein